VEKTKEMKEEAAKKNIQRKAKECNKTKCQNYQ